MRQYGTVGATAYKNAVNKDRAAKDRQRRRQKAQLAAKANIGCEHCRASKDEIRNEQARLRAEFYARHPELAA